MQNFSLKALFLPKLWGFIVRFIVQTGPVGRDNGSLTNAQWAGQGFNGMPGNFKKIITVNFTFCQFLK